jgi:hypothetical protein
MDAAIFGLIVADLIASPMDLRNPPKPGGWPSSTPSSSPPAATSATPASRWRSSAMKVAAAGLVGRRPRRRDTDRLNQAASIALASSRMRAPRPAPPSSRSNRAASACFFHTPGVTKLLDAAAFRRCIPTFAKCDVVQIGYFGLLPR